ncbi:MAG: fibronectin type III domain-containing protein, partial [Chitinophagaceae bacterium]
GVQNKWFYILVNGESGVNDLGNAYAVTGIGWEKAARIAYRNLTVYLSASSGYAAARTGAIQAATDLFGAGSAEVIAVANAWYAVGVGCQYGAVCYCASSANSFSDEWIASVTVGSFTNTSTNSPYTFFIDKTIIVNPGVTYPVRLVPGFLATKFPEYFRLWIDFNRDNDFDDAGELAFDAGAAVDSARSGSLRVPLTASLGMTRMRVSMKYATGAQPCENFSWGEVEDYLVNIQDPNADNTAPSAPVLNTSLVTTNSIALSWTAATDNVSVAGYDVYLDGVKQNNTLLTALSFTLNSLTPTTNYSIYVTARDQAGNSTNSNTLLVTTLTPPDTMAPTAPVITASSITTTSVVLSWTAATDNVGVAGYDVYVGGVKQNSVLITGLTYTLSELAPSTNYSIYVIARDQAGNSTSSNTLVVTTLTP